MRWLSGPTDAASESSEIHRGADQHPFGPDFLETTKRECAETKYGLDPAERSLGEVFSFLECRSTALRVEFALHRLHLATVTASRRPSITSHGNVAIDVALS